MSQSVLHFGSPETSAPAPKLAADDTVGAVDILAALRDALRATASTIDGLAGAVTEFLDAPELVSADYSAAPPATPEANAAAESSDAIPNMAEIMARNEAAAREAEEAARATPVPVEPIRNKHGETAAEALGRALNDAGAHALAVAEAEALTLVTLRDSEDVMPLLHRLGYAIAATPRADFGATIANRGRWSAPDDTAHTFAALVRRAIRVAGIASRLDIGFNQIASALGYRDTRQLQQAVATEQAEHGPIDLDPEYRRVAGLLR